MGLTEDLSRYESAIVKRLVDKAMEKKDEIMREGESGEEADTSRTAPSLESHSRVEEDGIYAVTIPAEMMDAEAVEVTFSQSGTLDLLIQLGKECAVALTGMPEDANSVDDDQQAVAAIRAALKEGTNAVDELNRFRVSGTPDLQAVIAELRIKAADCRRYTGIPCQSENSWHADEYEAWADRLAALSSSQGTK